MRGCFNVSDKQHNEINDNLKLIGAVSVKHRHRKENRKVIYVKQRFYGPNVRLSQWCKTTNGCTGYFQPTNPREFLLLILWTLEVIPFVML